MNDMNDIMSYMPEVAIHELTGLKIVEINLILNRIDQPRKLSIDVNDDVRDCEILIISKQPGATVQREESYALLFRRSGEIKSISYSFKFDVFADLPGSEVNIGSHTECTFQVVFEGEKITSLTYTPSLEKTDSRKSCPNSAKHTISMKIPDETPAFAMEAVRILEVLLPDVFRFIEHKLPPALTHHLAPAA